MASSLEKYIKESTKLNNGPPVRYQLPLKRVNLDNLSDGDSKLCRFTFGQRDCQYPNRTLLLVGETGSGKSTLINALVNYAMGVKFENKAWFEIIADEKNRPQAESQTSSVSVYDVFGFEGKTLPYSLTIIDTPGYGDTRGIDRDNMVTKTLQDLFSVPEGVDTIDAVGLVLKASTNRLDERTTYIFNSITSLFGRDMEKNIVAMVTHSCQGKPKDALQALESAKIRCAREKNEPVYFRFNNRQKETIEDDSDDEDEACQAFSASEKSMKKFTDFLLDSKSQSLKSTVQVLKERIRLTACIQNIEERVSSIEVKQEAIKKNREELAKLGTLTTENKHIIIKVEESYKEKEKINHWWDYKATTCNICKENCHYPGCTIALKASWCEVMKKGRCTSCSGKCSAAHHVRDNWRYVTKTRTVTKPAIELMNLEKEKSDLEKEKNRCLEEAFHHILQLEKIALNVDSVSTYQHLEFLMEKMKEKGDTMKLKKLEEIRNRMNEADKAGANYFMRYFKLEGALSFFK